jgi:hypothetical protein
MAIRKASFVRWSVDVDDILEDAQSYFGFRFLTRAFVWLRTRPPIESSVLAEVVFPRLELSLLPSLALCFLPLGLALPGVALPELVLSVAFPWLAFPLALPVVLEPSFPELEVSSSAGFAVELGLPFAFVGSGRLLCAISAPDASLCATSALLSALLPVLTE